MNAAIMKSLVKKALSQLNGDWVVIGGTVLPLVGADYRQTIDIDHIPVDGVDNDKLLDAMKLAESLGLPVEAINSAGAFFLSKIPNWRKRLVLHAESRTCRIFRPSFDLFLELKLARLSESDEADIIAYFKWTIETGNEIDFARNRKIISKTRAKQKSAATRSRLSRLEKIVSVR